MKKLLMKQRSDTPHWVGDGFPVRSIFNYVEHGKLMTPFLLMDYAGPTTFDPTSKRRGVGDHPHRGFETVTIVYQGEVEHRDSAGGGGVIKSGDVQWMSAAKGVVHQEFHSKDYAAIGGGFEMIQLWVNLPKKDKLNDPRYQAITNENIPVIELENNAGVARIISGQFRNTKGPAQTYTAMNLWDMKLNEGADINLELPEGHSTSLFVLDGEIELSDGQTLSNADLGLFQRQGTKLSFKATKKSKVLFMGGEPIEEPIVGYGPFVMNSQKEIAQAFMDYENGLMGNIQISEV